ncbi:MULTISPECIES: hypothetical protein [Pseudarthrobacter]|uniref:Uncharacterized protein n=1 Tax=Pseudarthrobacter niigatensis TaxID=369935 RepID=A0AAJ1SSA9_9MICC|nr:MULTISPECIES: hypothetical protein [Pseudarthrobacter]MDQ0146257.1 hypothetical protein [Pseudarthrobacter niigatensis]MDQ0264807.1 hypothetical protein [Pseudarthrobacter niigatensis]QDG64235.1 hypothetical protein NIBR502771_19265 [Pseudarthrobacter sp. NIBRBAC000502771]
MDNYRDEPPPAKEPPPPGQREPRHGYLGAGTVFGALALYILYLWATIGIGAPTISPPVAWGNSIFAGPAAFVPIAVYLGVAIVLAVSHRTALTGAGMLLGLGIFLLLGGGLCVGVLAQARI